MKKILAALMSVLIVATPTGAIVSCSNNWDHTSAIAIVENGTYKELMITTNISFQDKNTDVTKSLFIKQKGKQDNLKFSSADAGDSEITISMDEKTPYKVVDMPDLTITFIFNKKTYNWNIHGVTQKITAAHWTDGNKMIVVTYDKPLTVADDPDSYDVWKKGSLLPELSGINSIVLDKNNPTNEKLIFESAFDISDHDQYIVTNCSSDKNLYVDVK